MRSLARKRRSPLTPPLRKAAVGAETASPTCARSGRPCPETRTALSRVETPVSPLPGPDRPEHHYRYDPAKSEAYTATTLAWLGDPAAEAYARNVLARLESSTDGPPRPRRAATARLDLSLALIAAGRHDEAAGTALEAVSSGRIVPSSYWRAREVIRAVADRGVPEAAELAEAYREACGNSERPALPL
jgi:hypothetical protein